MAVDMTDGLKWYLAFIFSTTVHEAAHAWTALKLGDDTAHRGGQVTLNPIPHISRSPVGMVVVPVLSFFLGGWMIGWASAPYNARWAILYPRRAAAMSLAGPASNFLLMVTAALLIRIGMLFHLFNAPDRLAFTHVTESMVGGIFPFLATMLSILFSLNLLLCIFNLMPFPPLDGSGLLMFFAPDHLAEKLFTFLHQPALTYFGLMVSWRLFDSIFPPIQLLAVNCLYPGFGYH